MSTSGCVDRCKSALSWVEQSRLPCSCETDPSVGELFALQRAHGTAAALSSLSCKGVEEELAGVPQADMLNTVEQKLFGVPGREVASTHDVHTFHIVFFMSLAA